MIDRVKQIISMDEFSGNFILSATGNEKTLKNLKIETDGTYENPFNELWEIRVLSKFKHKYRGLKERLINYSLHGDLVKKLSVQNGKNICVDILEKSSGDGGLVETAKTMGEGGNFDWHGINNFLPFFDNSGNIAAETLRENYMNNFIKNLFFDPSSKKPAIRKTFNISKRGDFSLTKNYVLSEVLQEFMTDNIIRTLEVLDIISLKYILSYNISSTIKNKTSKYFICDDKTNVSKEITLGAFNNCRLLHKAEN